MKFHFSNRTGGFSLIELMVVLVLIAIMSALIVPEMKGTFEDALLRSTGRDLASAFGTAYSRAVTLNQLHQVRFNRSENRFFIETMNRRSGSPGERLADGDFPGSKGKWDGRISLEIRDLDQEPDGGGSEDEARRIDDELRTPAERDSIRFFADGTADGKQVVLTDRDGFRVALRINPITSRVKVVELERDARLLDKAGGAQ